MHRVVWICLSICLLEDLAHALPALQHFQRLLPRDPVAVDGGHLALQGHVFLPGLVLRNAEKMAAPAAEGLNGVGSHGFTSSSYSAAPSPGAPHSPCSRASSVSCNDSSPMASIPGLRRSTPFSPPSGPPQRLFQGPPAKSKFLAAPGSGADQTSNSREAMGWYNLLSLASAL